MPNVLNLPVSNNKKRTNEKKKKSTYGIPSQKTEVASVKDGLLCPKRNCMHLKKHQK